MSGAAVFPDSRRSIRTPFIQLSVAVLDDPDLSDGAVRLYGWLKHFARQSGRCWPAQHTLAACMHRSVDAVQRYLAELKSAGHIRVHRQGQTGNLYELVSDMPAAAPPHPAGCIPEAGAAPGSIAPSNHPETSQRIMPDQSTAHKPVGTGNTTDLRPVTNQSAAVRSGNTADLQDQHAVDLRSIQAADLRPERHATEPYAREKHIISNTHTAAHSAAECVQPDEGTGSEPPEEPVKSPSWFSSPHLSQPVAAAGDECALLDILCQYGIASTAAERLIHAYRDDLERIRRNLDWAIPRLTAARNPGAYLAAAIRDDYAGAGVAPERRNLYADSSYARLNRPASEPTGAPAPYPAWYAGAGDTCDPAIIRAIRAERLARLQAGDR